MNKYTNKLRKKYNRHTKKKHTNRKNKRRASIILEKRFKNLNAKTVKALQNKFRKERLLLKNKRIVNREQIGCSSIRIKDNREQIGCSRNMSGGFAFLTDAATSTYNSLYGHPQVPSSDPIEQNSLGNNSSLIS